MLVSSLFAVTMANADTVAALAEKGRLLGRWAQDCSKPPAYNNLHQTYEALNDGSVRSALCSGEYVDSNTNKPAIINIALVVHIDILTPTKIAMQLLDVASTNHGTALRYEVIVEIKNDRLIWFQSILANGEVVYKDGQSVMPRRPSPVFLRCSEPSS